MMKIIFHVALGLLLFAGCAGLSKYGKLEKEARRSFQNGNYDHAVQECAASLCLNPRYEKAQLLMKDAFRVAVNAHQSRIEQFLPSTAKFKWDGVVAALEALIQLNETV